MSLFEVGMLLCFGLAWPLNIYKSITCCTTKGKSVFFLLVVWIGYVFGITHKILYSNDIVLWLYVLNLIMVSVDIGLYFRNQALEQKNPAPGSDAKP